MWVALLFALLVGACLPPGYLGGGTQQTATSLTIVVRDAASRQLVAGAYVQILGPSIRAGTTDRNGRVLFSGIEPGSYLIEGQKGRRAAQDRISVRGPVTALMYIG